MLDLSNHTILELRENSGYLVTINDSSTWFYQYPFVEDGVVEHKGEYLHFQDMSFIDVCFN